MHVNIRRVTLLLVLSCATACSGLVTENMVTDQTSFGVKHSSTVALDIGADDPDLWYSSALGPEELEAALRMSMEKSGLFRAIVGLDSADYVLSVNVTYAGIQSGVDVTAWVNADWTLSARESSAQAWAARIVSRGRVSVDDAPDGGAWGPVAFERGTKANIEQALTQVAELPLRVPLVGDAP